jgi:hypothetical protein
MFAKLTLDSYEPLDHLKPVANLTRTQIAHVCDESTSQSRVYFDLQHVLTFEFSYDTSKLTYECVDADLLQNTPCFEPVMNAEHFIALCMIASSTLSAEAFA